MKKQILGLLALFVCHTSMAQYDYSANGRNDAPVLGMQWGLAGGGFTSMLTNRDDIAADKRLDPQMMNFSYAAGVEGIYWFQRTVGFGGQLLYWNGGAKYLGDDTLTKLKLTAQTKMTYIKLPLMFYFKSYNRYYPNRRTRFNAMFGPYVSVLQSFTDKSTFKNDDIGFKTETTIDNGGYKEDGLKAKIDGSVYKPFDLGFSFGFGVEARLWRRTVVALTLRTDIGIIDVEDKRERKLKFENDTTNYSFKYWDGLYAKYNSPNALDKLAGFQANRPATKNFSLGAFLSIRKYFGK